MRKEVIGPVLAALLVGGLIGYFGASGMQSSQISELQSQLTQLQSQLTALQTEKASVEFFLADAQSQITSLTTDKQALRQQVSQLNASIAQLNTKIAQLNAKIADLNATIAALRVIQGGELSILSVNFSPRGGCASTVIYWMGRANSSVHVLIYSFTLDSIGDAVLSAYSRGVEVKVVFEKQQVSQYSEFFRLAAAGVSVRNDTNPSLMHHKVAIIDGHIILIGSFNWSASAEEDNNENLLVIRSAALAATLEAEFQQIWTTGR